MTIDEVFYNHHKKYGNNRPDILKLAIKQALRDSISPCSCGCDHAEYVIKSSLLGEKP